MILNEGIEVQVFSNGHPLTEYARPASDDTSPLCTAEKYIEAQSNSTFVICVTWRKGFRLHGASHFQLVVRIDGGALRLSNIYDFRSYRTLSGDSLAHDMRKEIRESDPYKDGNGWLRHAFTFAEAPIGKLRYRC